MRTVFASLCLLPALSAAQFVPMGTPDPNECDYTTIARGQAGGMGGQTMLVFDSAAAMMAAWPRLTGQPAQAAPTREVQWGRQRAIAVSLGEQPAGTTVAISSIRRQNGRWVVKAGSSGSFGRQKGKVNPWAVVAVESKVSNPVLAINTYSPSLILGGFPAYSGYPSYPGYPPNDPGYPGGGCPYEIFRSGGNCLVTSETVIIISTPAAFVGWYGDAFGNDNRTQLPRVDWTSERLVAVHAGKLDNPNLTLKVKGIRRTTKGLMVDATLVPGQGGSSPWTLVRLPAGNEPVQLVVER
ncbi:hypothetical protein BH11ARM2_BH11ARM2_00240 [soil metagenome]